MCDVFQKLLSMSELENENGGGGVKKGKWIENQ